MVNEPWLKDSLVQKHYIWATVQIQHCFYLANILSPDNEYHFLWNYWKFIQQQSKPQSFTSALFKQSHWMEAASFDIYDTLWTWKIPCRENAAPSGHAHILEHWRWAIVGAVAMQQGCNVVRDNQALCLSPPSAHTQLPSCGSTFSHKHVQTYCSLSRTHAAYYMIQSPDIHGAPACVRHTLPDHLRNAFLQLSSWRGHRDGSWRTRTDAQNERLFPPFAPLWEKETLGSNSHREAGERVCRNPGKLNLDIFPTLLLELTRP